MFFVGIEHFPLLDKSTREASDSNGGMLSVGEILTVALIEFSLCQGRYSFF